MHDLYSKYINIPQLNIDASDLKKLSVLRLYLFQLLKINSPDVIASEIEGYPLDLMLVQYELFYSRCLVAHGADGEDMEPYPCVADTHDNIVSFPIDCLGALSNFLWKLYPLELSERGLDILPGCMGYPYSLEEMSRTYDKICMEFLLSLKQNS